jgi:hypothetical protein
MYHAFIYEKALADLRVLSNYQAAKNGRVGLNKFLIIVVTDPASFINDVQKSMYLDKPIFFHIYDNGISMKIVFKGTVFSVNPNNKNTWIAAQRHGKTLGLTPAELDFFPTRIKEEERL